MLKELNKLGQKISKTTKFISDVNAINQATQGNVNPVKKKVKNKIKNKLFNTLFK